MNSDAFEARCENCFGLCCTALSFSRGDQFGHDKLAGDPCHYLEADFRCRIHARREELGYEGCEAFDCLGAGQRASALFAGENWRRDPSIARRMHAGFALLMRLQEMRQALDSAEELDLAPLFEVERMRLLFEIAGLAECGREDIAAEAGAALAAARAFFERVASTVGA